MGGVRRLERYLSLLEHAPHPLTRLYRPLLKLSLKLVRVLLMPVRRKELLPIRNGLELHRVGVALFIVGFGVLAALNADPEPLLWAACTLPGSLLGLAGSLLLLRAPSTRLAASLALTIGLAGLACALLSLFGAESLLFHSYICSMLVGLILLALSAKLACHIPKTRLRLHALAMLCLFASFLIVPALTKGPPTAPSAVLLVTVMFAPALVYALILGRMARSLEAFRSPCGRAS